jgi:hypothetical protein
MTRSIRRRPVVAILLFLGACHPDGSGQIGSPVPLPPRIPTAEEAQDIGDRIDEHTQDLLIAFNVQELLIFELPVRALHRETGAIDPRRFPRAGGCPTVDDGTDSDGDGVPDDATFTFAGGGCTEFVDSVGTFTRSGSVAIVDIGTEPGYQLAWEDYRVQLDAIGGGVSVVALNGTWDVTADATSATLQEFLEMTTEEQAGAETTTGTFTFDWTAHFESDGEPLDLSLPLPSGSLVVQGPMTWTLDELSFSFDASTSEDIAFDAGCTAGLEFLAGAIRALQQDGWGTVVDVRYQGCGLEPHITYAPGY